MSIAMISVMALLLAIGVSMMSRINVGLIAIALAWLVGVYVADMKPDAVMAGFPAALFLTLCGVTLLFGIAEVNGSFSAIAYRATGLVRGNSRLIPIVLFLIAGVLAAIGPGAIAAVALLAPIAIAVGVRAQLPPMLTALMVANGANAGNLSPISAVGIIANTKMADAGLVGYEWQVMLANFAAHLLVAMAAYIYFVRRIPASVAVQTDVALPDATLDSKRWLTVGVLTVWIVCVIFLKVNLGLAAFAAAAVLIALRVADEGAAFRKIPLGVIMMVCGVSVLIALLEKNGGMELFSSMLARIATANSINGVIAFVTGLISTYSSTSGVVLPAFLPTVPSLVTQLGGGDPLAISLSINVGSSLVDVSPLSTIGALCVAAVADPVASRKLFYQLLIWGFSMSIVAALLCQMFAGVMAGGH
jgi:Na+/H+ antiporter NhaD/arsenite permease-like protein